MSPAPNDPADLIEMDDLLRLARETRRFIDKCHPLNQWVTTAKVYFEFAEAGHMHTTYDAIRRALSKYILYSPENHGAKPDPRKDRIDDKTLIVTCAGIEFVLTCNQRFCRPGHKEFGAADVTFIRPNHRIPPKPGDLT